MTEKARKSQLLDSGLSAKANMQGNPHIVKLKRDGEGSLRTNEIF